MVATRNITDLNALTVPAADDILLIVDRLSATSNEEKKITWRSKTNKNRLTKLDLDLEF